MKLHTRRLTLRELEDPDFQAVHEYASDPEVSKFMNWGPNGESETRQFLQLAKSYRFSDPRLHFEFAIVLDETQALIGSSGIHITNQSYRQAYIGYAFNRLFWGRGYGTEAANALLDFGFRDLKLHRIYAHADPNNTASRRVLENIKMRLEGQLRENSIIRGNWRDDCVYSILEQEYRPASQKQLQYS
ncbi:MAG: GNAT family N-acetyltransferase [Nitrososphaerota archaeon]|nr:GNAT family N-acetyltransferase [Nitrososphaerota archaeon]MDG6923389.1 GNAT family N-acetyltransferase [Nitrososphaerota archaeon]